MRLQTEFENWKIFSFYKLYHNRNTDIQQFCANQALSHAQMISLTIQVQAKYMKRLLEIQK